MIAYEWHNQDSRIKPVDVAATLNCNAGGREGHLVQNITAISLQDTTGRNKLQNGSGWSCANKSYTVDTQGIQGVLSNMAVRRLTPIECERLQGFPDGYTDIKPNGKETPDGHRYKALGNSMAVPVMRWIGGRINSYEAMCSKAVV